MCVRVRVCTCCRDVFLNLVPAEVVSVSPTSRAAVALKKKKKNWQTFNLSFFSDLHCPPKPPLLRPQDTRGESPHSLKFSFSGNERTQSREALYEI